MSAAGTSRDATLKLPQLQNFCKRDPVAYRDDYQAQTRRLESEIALLAQQQQQNSHKVVELIQFCAAVASSSYRGEEADRIALLLMNMLGKEKGDYTAAASMDKDVRKACVSALIIMRNKGAVSPLELLQLFFNVMVCVVDKGLREMLYRHMVNDIRNINKKGKRDEKVNRAIQSFLHRIVQTAQDSTDEQTELASKRAVDMVCELYRRRVWTDERAVAIVATAVESPFTAVSNRGMRFFLGTEELMAADEQAHIENEFSAVADRVDYHFHSRKTSKRHRQTTRALKNKKKAQTKKEIADNDGVIDIADDEGVEASKKLFPAIELLRDPQGLAESVFKRLRNAREKYETKLLRINFVTRLTGNHELLILPLYSFLQKNMGGHQRNVTAILAYAVQACHAMVPPEEIYGILKTIAHNFITERCTEEQMAVGINAARAICARVPAVMSVEEAQAATSSCMDLEAFARDLASFAKHRDRSVRTAGASWLNWIRQVHPGLLRGKNRGMEGSALHKNGSKPLRFGEQKASVGVEGADLLVEYESKKAAAMSAEGEEVESEPDEDETGSADDEDEDGSEADADEESDEDEVAPDLVNLAKDGGDVTTEPIDLSKMSQEERDLLKQEVSSTRIFSSADFVKMRKLVQREETLKRDPRAAARRKRAIARGEDFEALSEDEADSSDDSDDNGIHVKGAVDPTDIMAAATRRRQSKAEKIKKIIAGRSEFESKQRDGGSTNTEKKRKKNFLMSKFSRESRTKGRGKGDLKRKKKDMGMGGTHEAKKRRRKS